MSVRIRKDRVILVVVAFVFIIAITFAAVSGCSRKNDADNTSASTTAHQSVTVMQTTAPTTTEAPTTIVPTTTVPPTTAITAATTAVRVTTTHAPAFYDGDYNYGAPVPASDATDDSFFSDSVFVGDSRTQGLFLYTDMGDTATMYAYKGLNVSELNDEKVIKVGDSKVSVVDALKKNKTFKKVYIMFGINEMGWTSTANFIKYYSEFIDNIRKINPDAVIYVQSVITVTESRSESDKTFNLKNIDKFNALLIDMCANKKVYYINVNEAVENKKGFLPEDASTDGIHMNSSYCKKWKNYLKTHTVTASTPATTLTTVGSTATSPKTTVAASTTAPNTATTVTTTKKQ